MSQKNGAQVMYIPVAKLRGGGIGGHPPPPQLLPNDPSNKIRSKKNVCTAFVKKVDILRRDQRNTRRSVM